jgi:hypothetical protein
MHTQSIHFDEGFTRNNWGWVTNIWEAEMVHEFGKELVCSALERWVADTKKRWPDTHFVSFGEFGSIWRSEHQANETWNYSFLERGCGLGDSYNNLEIEWFMNKYFRLAFLRDWHQNTPRKVIDFTRYDLTAHEPPDPSPEHPEKSWDLMNRINQKQLRPQDTPVLLSEMSLEDREFIFNTLPVLKNY